MGDPAKGEKQIAFILRWTGAGKRRSVLAEARRGDFGSRAARHVMAAGLESGSTFWRAITVGFFVFATALFGLLAGLFAHADSWIAAGILGALGAFFLYCAVVLAFSPHVSAWMREARERSRRMDDRVRWRGRRPLK